MKDTRSRFWVDQFQTTLCYRVGMYWLLYTFTLFNLLFGWRLLQHGAQNLGELFVSTVFDNVPLFVCFILVAPWIAFDSIQFANRIVGPLHRFRKTMSSVALNEPVRPIRLRKHDFLRDLQDEFNAMLAALEQRGAVQCTEPDAPSTEAPAKVGG